jgi:hypothetical protein
MAIVNDIARCRGNARRVRLDHFLPKIRQSILDPCLENEPWLDFCPCTQTSFLFVNNRPITSIRGTSLDLASSSIRLNQLRCRNPRQG